MPKPRSGEKKKDFIKRCMGSAEANKDFPDASQRRAVCESFWDRRGNSVENSTYIDDLLQINAAVTSLTREETLHDRPHLVVPVVMVREMVLPHRGRKELLPEAALALTVAKDQWEGRPVVVRHPRRHGRYVSAGTVASAEEFEIGRIQNTKMDQGKLKGELWIDIEVAEQHDDGEQILSDFRENKIIEVSTGYLADSFPEVGTFGNETFDHVQVNIRPDHIAILPDEVGKCSVADGCGAGRMNVQTSCNLEGCDGTCDICSGERTNAISHEDLRKGLREELHELERIDGASDFLFVEAVFDDRVIYQINEGPLLERGYLLGDAPDYAIELAEDSEEVRRIIDFVSVNSEEDDEMSSDSKPKPNGIGVAISNLLTAVGFKGNTVVIGDGQTDNEVVACCEEHANSDEKCGDAPRNCQEDAMKEKLIDFLVNSEDHDFEKEELESLDVKVLTALAGDGVPEDLAPPAVTDDGGAAPAADGEVSDEGAGSGSVEDEEDESVALSKSAVLSALGVEETDFDEAIANVKADRDAEETERTEIMDRLTANSDFPFTKENIEGMDLDGLHKLDQQYGGPVPDFAGRGGPRTNARGEAADSYNASAWSDGVVTRRGPKPEAKAEA